ncbi:MAG: (Na+)-NQR maturation NqrM [Succinivibrionaceae bacterium]
MMLFIYTLIGFLLFFLLAAIGYIVQKKVINGSCGGLANVGVEKVCSCEKPCFKRRIKNKIAEITGKSSEESNNK